MATSTYYLTTRRQPKDKTTRTAGYDHTQRRVDREQPDYLTLLNWLIDLDETPKGGRCNFWQGMKEAVEDALTRKEMEALGIAEAQVAS